MHFSLSFTMFPFVQTSKRESFTFRWLIETALWYNIVACPRYVFTFVCEDHSSSLPSAAHRSSSRAGMNLNICHQSPLDSLNSSILSTFAIYLPLIKIFCCFECLVSLRLARLHMPRHPPSWFYWLSNRIEWHRLV